jgi:hypothetical protein
MTLYTHTDTRDVSIIAEEAWFRALTMGLGKIFDWVNPYPVPAVYVVKREGIEAWEDAEAYQWIRDQLHKEVMLRPQMLGHVVERFQERSAVLAQICQKGCPPNAAALLEFLELFLDAMIDFVIVYFIAADERTPVGERTIANALCEGSSFFQDNDACIRASILCVYPHLKGLERVIRYREIKYDKAPMREELEARERGWVVVPGELYELGDLDGFAKTHSAFVFERNNS